MLEVQDFTVLHKINRVQSSVGKPSMFSVVTKAEQNYV